MKMSNHFLQPSELNTDQPIFDYIDKVYFIGWNFTESYEFANAFLYELQSNNDGKPKQ